MSAIPWIFGLVTIVHRLGLLYVWHIHLLSVLAGIGKKAVYLSLPLQILVIIIAKGSTIIQSCVSCCFKTDCFLPSFLISLHCTFCTELFRCGSLNSFCFVQKDYLSHVLEKNSCYLLSILQLGLDYRRCLSLCCICFHLLHIRDTELPRFPKKCYLDQHKVIFSQLFIVFHDKES